MSDASSLTSIDKIKHLVHASIVRGRQSTGGLWELSAGDTLSSAMCEHIDICVQCAIS